MPQINKQASGRYMFCLLNNVLYVSDINLHQQNNKYYRVERWKTLATDA